MNFKPTGVDSYPCSVCCVVTLNSFLLFLGYASPDLYCYHQSDLVFIENIFSVKSYVLQILCLQSQFVPKFCF